MKKTVIPAIIGLLVAVAATIGVWLYYNRMVSNTSLEEMQETSQYSRHYVLITENPESNFWNSVYESAKNEAAKNDAYLEFAENGLSSDYAVSEYLEISIAAKVDGIIVESNGEPEVEELIEKAGENNIPVITVMEDTGNTESTRKSFVGINSYELGQAYGDAISQFVMNDTKKVLVLLNEDEENANIFAYLKKTLKEKMPKEKQLEVEAYPVDNKTAFDTEETIRDIFLNEEWIPDILVCLEETDTECAYQALIDYNKVGVVNIIGCYPSDTILSAVDKGIVSAVFELNTEKIGKDSVNALIEFANMGHVSDYYSVDIEMITKENAQQNQDQ